MMINYHKELFFVTLELREDIQFLFSLNKDSLYTKTLWVVSLSHPHISPQGESNGFKVALLYFFDGGFSDDS